MTAKIRTGIGTSGVYLLASKGRIVYIGRSHCCEARIREHTYRGLEFDSFWFGECRNINTVERRLVKNFKPHLNNQFLGRFDYKHSPPRRKGQDPVLLFIRSVAHRSAKSRINCSHEDLQRRLL